MITSKDNKLIKEITKLHKKKHRDNAGLFILEGEHLYSEAVKHGEIVYVFTTLDLEGDNVYKVNSIVMDKLCVSTNNQTIVTVCKKVENKEVTNKVLLLDHIQDPGNLGTLLRSAKAFNFNTIVLDNCVDLYNDKVIRATQGLLFNLNIHITDIISFMDTYSHISYFGTIMNGTEFSSVNETNIGIILGNEGSGVREEVLKKTNDNITIKTSVESLNVAIAGSILMQYFSS